MTVLHAIKNNLFGNLSPISDMHRYAEDFKPFFTAGIIVRVYYFFLLYSSIILFQQWDFNIGPKTEISYIPTLFWIPFIGFTTAFVLIKLSFIAVSLLVSLAPQWRLLRIISFITVLEFVSLYYSVLQLDVDWYTLVLTSFFLIFLPVKWGKSDRFPKIERQKFLFVIWGIQAITLVTYSMSGIGKTIAAIIQTASGQTNILAPQAAALVAADRIITTQGNAPLAGFVVDYYYLIWPFFLGDLYLLIFSFFIAFKPRLHKLWGLGIILFHITNYLVIDIGFNAHIFMTAILFLISPFAPPTNTLTKIIYDLPIVGIFANYFKPIKRV